jgi:hypothetical protein
MKKLTAAVMVVVAMAMVSQVQAADKIGSIELAGPAVSVCNYTAHKDWPVARFLTAGIWPGPEQAAVELILMEAPNKAVQAIAHETDKEVMKTPQTAYIIDIACHNTAGETASERVTQ